VSVAVDASSPVRWSGQNIANNATFASASFTPPAGSVIVICVNDDSTTSEAGNAFTLSGGGLTYAALVERLGTETTTGGYSGIYKATGASGAAVTITATRTSGTASTGRFSAKAYVLTGVDATTPFDTVGASNEGGSATNNLTTSSVTPGANGLLIACDTDWNTLGAFEASSDLTQDTATYPSAISVCSGYKAVTSGVGATANLNAAGTGAPQHKWTQVVARETAGATKAPAYLYDKPAAMNVMMAL
jgi:hypothetical protein